MTIQIPDAADHGRFFKNGWTRYSYEDIVSTVAEFDKCEKEYEDLVAQAFWVIGDHDKLGGMVVAPESIQALYSQLNSIFIPSIQLGDGKEHWPVNTWKKSIASYRALNRKVRKALSEAERETANV